MKVLIAEDDPVSCLVLERTLQRWGYEVVKSRNGEEAWSKYLEDPLSLVITDWMMPQTDGLELCRRIRQLKREQYTYVILLTAKSQKSEMIEGLNAGADDFITKPFDSAELYARIRAGERVLDLETSLTEGQREIKSINAQLQRSIERQNLINQLLRVMTSSLDFNYVIQNSVAPLRQLFGASRAIVRLVRGTEHVLQLVAENCLDSVSRMGTIQFPIEKDERVGESEYNSVMVFRDLATEQTNDRRMTTQMLAHGYGVKALLSSPLHHQGTWFGDISVHSCDLPRHWGEDEVNLLNTIAQQMSVVAANSDLHRKVQEQTIRDPLTGLFNRRHFDYALEAELERAGRYNQPLSLVMVDLDSLKKINDLLGHLSGDAAIQKVGAILLRQSRRVDIATRIGGDEFAVVLPQTTPEGAKAAAEHWRRAIANSTVGELKLAASIGIAAFPADATTAPTLIAAADAALYKSKRSGGNSICEAGALELEAASGEKI